jgi:hypothetical protein
MANLRLQSAPRGAATGHTVKKVVINKMIDEKKVGNTYMAVVRIVNVRVNPTFKYGPEGCRLGRPSADCFAEQEYRGGCKGKTMVAMHTPARTGSNARVGTWLR